MEFIKEKMFRKRNKSKCNMVNDNRKLELLLKCVEENDLEELRNIIKKNPNIINESFRRDRSNLYQSEIYYRLFRYINIDCCTILVSALTFLANTTSMEMIEVLIELDASLYYDCEEWNSVGLDAIHFAVLGGNPQLLKCIINHIDPDKMNSRTMHGHNALQLLIRYGKESDPDFIKCIEVLLENNINVNQTDNRNFSAIYSAAFQNYIKVVDILLKCTNINLDNITIHNKTARNLLIQMHVDVGHIPIYIPEDREQLLHYLKLKKETEFVELASIVGIDNEDDIHEPTYLQYACKNNLLKVVEYLLSHNVDVNKTKSSRQNVESPINIAAVNGYHKIFKLLIEIRFTKVKDTILSDILRNISRNPCHHINYYLCYKYLMMNRKYIDVNIKDKFGYYPLSYSRNYGGTEVTLSLLNFKASLGNRNDDGHLTIKSVDYETLNNHLDNCIEECWGIIFDYATLLPTSEIVVEVDSNIIPVEEAAEPLNNEVETIELETISFDNSSLFSTKTDEVKIFLETEVVLHMSRSPELKSLLKHPVITSFLDIKWHRIRWIFYTNVLFYSIFYLALILHSIASFNSTNGQDFITYVFLIIMLILFIIREVFQFIIAPRKYIRNVENGIEVLLLIIVTWLLSIKIPFDKTRNQLCASAILLAALDLLYLLGNHPLLSTKIVMFRRVSSTFLNFFMSYLILLTAFALSFHILFNDTGSSLLSLESNNTETTQEDNNSFFANPFVSLFKTFIMFTGEFESGNLDFKQYPGTSHLIFLIFVITIAVILLNLLNGLAVSDTHNIMNDAELHGHVARAQFISYVESLIFTSLLTSGFIYRCYNLVNYQKQNRNKNLLVLKNLAKKISLFPIDIGIDNSAGIENGNVYFKDIDINRKWRSFSLDTKSIQKAKKIIQQKNDKEKYNRKKVEEKIHIETKEEEGKRRIDDLSNKINEITSVFQKEVLELHNNIKEITSMLQRRKKNTTKKRKNKRN